MFITISHNHINWVEILLLNIYALDVQVTKNNVTHITIRSLDEQDLYCYFINREKPQRTVSGFFIISTQTCLTYLNFAFAFLW